MRMKIKTLTMAAALPALFGGPALAEDAVGHWFGKVSTPVGVELTIAAHINRTPAGGLEGYAESPDQTPAPLPLADVKATPDTLTFAAPSAKAVFTGKWDAGAGAGGWVGVLRQNDFDMPLTLVRGAPPPHPVVAGLDGDWSGVIQAPQGDLRIKLHVKTGPDGTQALFESPDQSPMQLVAFLTRQDSDVSVTLRGIGGFFGKLSADGKALDGELRQGGGALPLVLKKGG